MSRVGALFPICFFAENPESNLIFRMPIPFEGIFCQISLMASSVNGGDLGAIGTLVVESKSGSQTITVGVGKTPTLIRATSGDIASFILQDCKQVYNVSGTLVFTQPRMISNEAVSK